MLLVARDSGCRGYRTHDMGNELAGVGSAMWREDKVFNLGCVWIGLIVALAALLFPLMHWLRHH